MTKYLISDLGFNNAVRAVAGLVAATALVSFFCAIPNPEHPLNKESEYSWGHIRRWIDPAAFKNATFNWFCASIAFMFFGFYAIFFNLEEVSSLLSSTHSSLIDTTIVGICHEAWSEK